MRDTHQAVLNLQNRIGALEGGRKSHNELSEDHEDNRTMRPDPILCFETSLSRKCHSRCRCQCHRPISRGSPDYLQPAIGAFFLSYKTLPVLGNTSCDDSACERRQNPRLEFHYYLPRWLFSRAVHFSLSWDSLNGMGATLHLKLPRVIDPKDTIWETIRCRDLDRVRERLSLRINTPVDVSPAGMSLLLVRWIRGSLCNSVLRLLLTAFLSMLLTVGISTSSNILCSLGAMYQPKISEGGEYFDSTLHPSLYLSHRGILSRI